MNSKEAAGKRLSASRSLSQGKYRYDTKSIALIIRLIGKASISCVHIRVVQLMLEEAIIIDIEASIKIHSS